MWVPKLQQRLKYKPELTVVLGFVTWSHVDMIDEVDDFD